MKLFLELQKAGLANLERLNAARAVLGRRQADALDDYLIGALSGTVNQEMWNLCLELAKRCAANVEEVA